MTKITITRGDSRDITVNYVDSDGAALDLTGAEVFLTVNSDKDPSDDTGAAIQKTVSSFADPTTGVATISLTNTDTTIAAGTYYYDIQVKDAGGNITSSPTHCRLQLRSLVVSQLPSPRKRPTLCRWSTTQPPLISWYNIGSTVPV